MRIEVVVDVKPILGEGPIWDVDQQRLYFIDSFGCNVFRYGQCNTHIPGITPVVCRMVVCENPSSIPALNCSGSAAVDNAVCDHEAPCLEPRPRQLAGAGGV